MPKYSTHDTPPASDDESDVSGPLLESGEDSADASEEQFAPSGANRTKDQRRDLKGKGGADHATTRAFRRYVAVSVLALAVSLGAAGVAVWGVIHRSPTTSTDAATPASAVSAPPVYSEAQRAAAKDQICTAVDTVARGITMNTNQAAPGGPSDAAGVLAVAANARVSLLGGGQYLLTRLDPAVPTDLSDAVRQFALQLLDFGAAATAGVPNTDPVQSERLRNADTLSGTVRQLCE